MMPKCSIHGVVRDCYFIFSFVLRLNQEYYVEEVVILESVRQHANHLELEVSGLPR
jgi:hypothetical protein